MNCFFFQAHEKVLRFIQLKEYGMRAKREAHKENTTKKATKRDFFVTSNRLSATAVSGRISLFHHRSIAQLDLSDCWPFSCDPALHPAL